MSILDRYIARAILGATALVLLVLLAISSFVEFVNQLNDVGTGGYGIPQALIFVGLRVPQMGTEMLPAAAMLGSLLGLGSLAGHSELIVMRAAGVSRVKLLKAAGLAGIVLMLVVGLVGEYFAPSLSQYARQYRTLLKNDRMEFSDVRDIWVRDGSNIINIAQQSEAVPAGGIYLFALDSDDSVDAIGRAENAHLAEDGSWVLQNYQETDISSEGMTVLREAQRLQPSRLDPDLLGVSEVRTGNLSLTELRRYADYLQRNGLDASAAEVALWSRPANAVATVFMCLLGLPFVFGSLRSAGTGGRLLIGLLIGTGYFLASRMLVNSGEVFGLDPVVVAWAPTAVLASITVVASLRVR